uniref:Transposase, mutator type n=1 Tax=Tanacetum cinerariifolium TaxID=118510 RepID=A0A6L2JL16_TANCI|nr:transposase, mutator type [Tanacetum cinerariifolium]
MLKLSVDLNEPKDSSKTDKATQNGRNPKSLTLEIHHDAWFTPTPSRSYIGGQPASSVARPIVVESVVDPFDGLDEILGDYANTRKQITRIRALGSRSVGVDANDGIYPVAYAILEAESKASWCWFLNLLGEDLGHQRRGRSQMMRLQVKVLHQESFLGSTSLSVVVNVAMWVITRKAAGVKVVVLVKLVQGRSLVKLLVQGRSLVKLLVQEMYLVKLRVQGRPQVNLVQNKAQQTKDQGWVFRDQ